MLIVRQRDLSPDDLAFLAARSNPVAENPAIRPNDLVIRDNLFRLSPGPACISSLVQVGPLSTREVCSCV